MCSWLRNRWRNDVYFVRVQSLDCRRGLPNRTLLAVLVVSYNLRFFGDLLHFGKPREILPRVNRL